MKHAVACSADNNSLACLSHEGEPVEREFSSSSSRDEGSTRKIQWPRHGHRSLGTLVLLCWPNSQNSAVSVAQKLLPLALAPTQIYHNPRRHRLSLPWCNAPLIASTIGSSGRSAANLVVSTAREYTHQLQRPGCWPVCGQWASISNSDSRPWLVPMQGTYIGNL